MAGNLRNGVPMATPVFDGADESDVSALLEKAGLKLRPDALIDGRTGENLIVRLRWSHVYA